MFAISIKFKESTSNAELIKHAEIIMNKHGFYENCAIYISLNDDMSKVMTAMDELKKLSNFHSSIINIIAFKLDQLSNFSKYIAN